jgi:hypothetical protein
VVVTPTPPARSTAIRRQAEALQAMGMSVEIFACRGRGFFNTLGAWTRLRPRLHRGRYDVVHTEDAADVWLALPKRVPLVTSVGRTNLVARLLARRADAVVVPSAEIGRQLHTRVPVQVLPPDLDETARAARLVELYQSVLP